MLNPYSTRGERSAQTWVLPYRRGSNVCRWLGRMLLLGAAMVRAQASVYEPFGSGFSDPSAQFRVGACRLDSRFFSCVSWYYPEIVLLIITSLPFLFWAMSRRRVD